MARLDLATSELLQGVGLLQLWGNNKVMLDLFGQFRVAPIIGTVILEFMEAEDETLLLYEDTFKVKLEGAS